MSTARLILKQPSGWFAAGREVAQALALLSDGAFKLYIHLCLEADRHTGRVGIEMAEWMRVLRKDPASIEAAFGELQGHDICDCVAATIAAVGAHPGEHYNVGGGESATVWDIIHKLEKLAGRKAVIRQEQARPGDQRYTFANTTKLRIHLG